MSRAFSSTLRQPTMTFAPCHQASFRLSSISFPTRATTRAPKRLRHQSTVSSSLSAEEAASSLLSRFAGQTRTATQVLDGNQLQKLSLTLNRRELWPGLDVSVKPPPVGTPLPRGYHLVYFTPGGVEGELGRDGSDLGFNAPGRFTRRMWAGGRMRWLDEKGRGDGAEAGGKGRGGGVELRVGDEVEERTRLTAATAKKSRDGSEMVLVNVEKEFWGPRGLALVDERSWIFRPEATSPSAAAEKALREAVVRGPSTVKDVPAPDGDSRSYAQRQLRWSPTGLFRFSALTFNGHKIHYDPTWSTAIEGHPACVVHGPLNLICMLDYWRDHCAGGGEGVQGEVREVSYRAVAPIYVGETYTIGTEAKAVEGKKDGELRWAVLVQKEGRICMKGDILGV
ncbi:hypothetical protein HD806DRAFT_540844 [Xylariaceae sp. AK1471]|nr:hypothetical protein HD806DRAFT_540844 [Xylariaceae sp. AK1471]